MQHWIGAGRYDLEFVVGPVWQEEIVIAQYQEELSILTSGRIPVIKPGILPARHLSGWRKQV